MSEKVADQLEKMLRRVDPDDAYRGFCIVAYDNRKAILAALRSTPAPDALREAREQGQREGKNAVCQWLRDRSATKPHAPFWKEAYALAVEFEHSEIPGRTEGKPS